MVEEVRMRERDREWEGRRRDGGRGKNVRGTGHGREGGGMEER